MQETEIQQFPDGNQGTVLTLGTAKNKVTFKTYQVSRISGCCQEPVETKRVPTIQSGNKIWILQEPEDGKFRLSVSNKWKVSFQNEIVTIKGK